jgi:AraC-like DNA-binding protein
MACGIYGCGIITCPDREHMVRVIERFAPFIDPFTAVTYRSNGNCYSWQLEPYFADDPEDPLYIFSIEMKLASSLRVARDLYGDKFFFEHIRVVCDNPRGDSYYSDLLQCPVYFNQNINEIVYKTNGLLLQRITNSDPITFKQIIQLCEKQAQAVRRTKTLSQEVARILRNHPKDLLGLDDVASMLSVNSWTLRRKLKNEGNTFSEISSEVKMDMAKNYLRKNALSIEEIAEMLGYSDASSFSKAFQAWAGQYPNQFRKSQRDAD